MRKKQETELKTLMRSLDSMGPKEFGKWLAARGLYGKNFKVFHEKYRFASNRKEAVEKISKKLVEWDTKDLKKLLDYCRNKNCDTITRLLRRRTKVPVTPGNIEGILRTCYPCAANRREFVALFNAKYEDAEKKIEKMRREGKREISEIFSDSPHLKNLADEPAGANVKTFKDIPPEIAERFKDSPHFQNTSSGGLELPPGTVTYFFSGGGPFTDTIRVTPRQDIGGIRDMDAIRNRRRSGI